MYQNEPLPRHRMRKAFVTIATIVALAIVASFIVFAYVGGKGPAESIRNECQKKKYSNGQDSFVCVCSGEHCDDIDEIAAGDIDSPDKLVYFISSRDSYRLQKFALQKQNETSVDDGKNAENQFEVRINGSAEFQRILGFGTAFTDAAGLMRRKLPKNAQKHLIDAYFDTKKGIRLTLGRVPVASTDFSTKIYSYNDNSHDLEMKTFALASEDFDLKIPDILTANRLSNGALRLVASVWSAPWWMKVSGQMQGGGPIRGQIAGGNDTFYKAYALYLRRFFEEYAKNGQNFWGMTMANEPNVKLGQDWWQGMVFDSGMQREFARLHLKPELRKSNSTKDILLFGCDDQRKELEEAAKEIYKDGGKELFAGLVFHWYSFTDYAPIRKTSELHPDKFLLSTEACTADQPGEVRGPLLGNWTRGWMYGHDILNDLLYGAMGWIDWNYCLDENGGPNWYGNTVDAPIIVNATGGEFYKQPMFYFLAHFSRFIPPNSVRIQSKAFNLNGEEISGEDGFFLKQKGLLEHIAFRTPSGQTVLILINGDGAKSKIVRIKDERGEEGKGHWEMEMPPDSIVTAILEPGK